jgi:N-methylhydantoinase A
MRDHSELYFLGIDTGGTFTDFILVGEDGIRSEKILSTPAAPEQAILDGIERLGLRDAISAGKVQITHGTTVATNAALEHKGAKTAFITNQGFGDILALGRQNRSHLYALNPTVDRLDLTHIACFEVDTRRNAKGTLIKPLGRQALEQLFLEVSAFEPEAIAVSLLFSFLDPSEEVQIREALRSLTTVISLSSELHPEPGEYERSVVTLLNSYLGPVVQGYLGRLCAAMAPTQPAIMQSSGLTIDANQAAARAAHLLLSGPAGGLIAASSCFPNSALMTFDMGGTSTDVALIHGSLSPSEDTFLGGIPLAIPALDLTTIGAGGGSIARVNEGGLLTLGPESAGALPGPACYQRGGQSPTVTDAHVVLGHFPEAIRLSDDIELSRDPAERVISPLASALSLTIDETAKGILQIANERMTQALRMISIQRGYDPKDFTLVCFGGAGGLHLCALAEALDMRRAVVPAHAAMFSALGMIMASPGRVFSKSIVTVFEHLQRDRFDTAISSLRKEAEQSFGVSEDVVRRDEWFADVRYEGQSKTLEVKLDQDFEQMQAEFESSHEARYGHRLDQPIEMVRLRLRSEIPEAESEAINQLKQPALDEAFQSLDQLKATHVKASSILDVRSLASKVRLEGPYTLTAPGTIIKLESGWSAMRDDAGHLYLKRA